MDTQNSNTNSDNTITEETAILNDNNFVLSPFQQWEIAFIYAFITTFNPQAAISPSFYKLPSLTPDELEAEIPKKESQLVHQFICASLSNALNRKKAIESYNNAFSQIVTDKYRAFDLDLDYNPLSHRKFADLDPNVKLLLLRSLVEWQLQDSQAIKSILEQCNHNTKSGQVNPIRSHPVGIDSKKRSYWQFGDSPWLWREKMQSKQGCHWEVVCKNRVELEHLVDQQLSSNNRAEKQLIKYITQVLYDVADKAERRQIRKEQAELRRLFPPEVSITPTQLRSRTRGARVNYNIDDAYDFVDEDDEYEEEETRRAVMNSPPRSAPTRWSSRLNDTEDSRWKELDGDDEDEVMSTLKSDTTMIDVVNDDDDLVQEKSQDTADINFSINNTVDREDLMEIADSNSQLTVNSAMHD